MAIFGAYCFTGCGWGFLIMKLLTRTEIVLQWGRSHFEQNLKPCCPFCRDNLSEYDPEVPNESVFLFCNDNPMCTNDAVYQKDGDYFEIAGLVENIIPEHMR